MKFLLYLSNYIIPFLIFYVVGLGLINKVSIYDEFVKGAKEGFQVVLDIMPTLVGLMVAVGILRASGSFDYISNFFGGFMEKLSFPSELVPLVIVKMFSSSAATSLVLDIFKQFGPDSYIGTLTSIIMSCTETIFYTMSVYFMTAKVTKTRWTLAGSLTATFAGIMASVILTGLIQ